VPNSWTVIRRAARDPQLRRLELGFAGFAIAEHGTWLTGLMYAYGRGGADEAGIVAVVLLAPGLLVAPVAAFAADRFESGRVLAVGYAIQATAMLLAAVAIAADIGSIPVYAAAMAAASGVTLTRPAMGVVLPNATHTPADLTAANVVMGFVEHTGMFIGPALAGVLVATSGLSAPFVVCGGLTAGAALLALRVRTVPGANAVTAGNEVGGVLGDTLDGLRALHGHRAARLMIGMLSLGSLVIGAADVLFVATAAHLTGGDTSRAGLFGSAFGVGAIVGSTVTVLLVGRARLTPSIAAAVAALGLSLAALATADGTAAVLALFFVMGGGESLLRVAAATMIQRISPANVVGRFFGVVEGLHMFSMAIGSGVIGLLVARLDYRAGLLAAGITVPAVLLLRLPRLFEIDRDAVAPDERVLELILGDDIFSALPAPTIERLAVDAERRHVPAGGVVITEGEPGDRYYIIDRGDVSVTRAGAHLRDLSAGAGLGELALLSDIGRAATVIATTDVDLLAFGRDPFLQAVTGHSHSEAIGRRRTEHYLGPTLE